MDITVVCMCVCMYVSSWSLCLCVHPWLFLHQKIPKIIMLLCRRLDGKQLCQPPAEDSEVFIVDALLILCNNLCLLSLVPPCHLYCNYDLQIIW